MKAKLTISVDEHVVPAAKRYAQRQGTSLSCLIEQALRDASASETPTFASRWRGRFKPARRDAKRYRLLARKYL
jgi:predicted nucleic-acid-binding protein